MSLLCRLATAPLVALLFATIAVPNAHANPTTLEMVLVGNPGNTADTTGYGAVHYSFAIGKYEVTVNEYTAFLNAAATSDPYGLYSTGQAIARTGSTGNYVYAAVGNGNTPVNNVSWFDAARFVNWLHNGSTATSSTEVGAYDLNGALQGTQISRNANASFFLPTIDEWYKAAYYDPTKNGAGGYWGFPTQSDVAPGNSLNALPNQANYFTSAAGRATYLDSRLTDVGSYANSDSAYGTFDQGGNVWEWNELVLSSTQRGQRGGSVYSSDYLGGGALWSGVGNKQDTWNTADLENVDIGFRVGAPAVAVPEPATWVMAAAGMACAIMKALQRRSQQRQGDETQAGQP